MREHPKRNEESNNYIEKRISSISQGNYLLTSDEEIILPSSKINFLKKYEFLIPQEYWKENVIEENTIPKISFNYTLGLNSFSLGDFEKKLLLKKEIPPDGKLLNLFNSSVRIESIKKKYHCLIDKNRTEITKSFIETCNSEEKNHTFNICDDINEKISHFRNIIIKTLNNNIRTWNKFQEVKEKISIRSTKRIDNINKFPLIVKFIQQKYVYLSILHLLDPYFSIKFSNNISTMIYQNQLNTILSPLIKNEFLNDLIEKLKNCMNFIDYSGRKLVFIKDTCYYEMVGEELLKNEDLMYEIYFKKTCGIVLAIIKNQIVKKGHNISCKKKVERKETKKRK